MNEWKAREKFHCLVFIDKTQSKTNSIKMVKQQQQQQQQKLNFDHKNLQIACGLLYKRSEMK